jgi:hypothetical protein
MIVERRRLLSALVISSPADPSVRNFATASTRVAAVPFVTPGMAGTIAVTDQNHSHVWRRADRRILVDAPDHLAYPSLEPPQQHEHSSPAGDGSDKENQSLELVRGHRHRSFPTSWSVRTSGDEPPNPFDRDHQQRATENGRAKRSQDVH